MKTGKTKNSFHNEKTEGGKTRPPSMNTFEERQAEGLLGAVAGFTREMERNEV